VTAKQEAIEAIGEGLGTDAWPHKDWRWVAETALDALLDKPDLWARLAIEAGIAEAGLLPAALARAERAERERDSLARRCAVRFEENEKLRAQNEYLPAALDVIARLLDDRELVSPQPMAKHVKEVWRKRHLGAYFDLPVTDAERAVLALATARQD